MRQLGIDNIVRRNRSLKETLLQALPQTHPSKDLLDVYKDQGGTLCLRPLDYDKTVSTLTTNKIQHDQRGDIFRISLHVMNTEDEARRIAECFV